MSLYVYRSQYVEHLADALAKTLKQTLAATPDPFASIPIVVGSRGMERWLRHAMAKRLGTLSGVDFPFPALAFEEAIRHALHLSPDSDQPFWTRPPKRRPNPWDGPAFTLRTLHALHTFRDEPAFTHVRSYLGPTFDDGPFDALALSFSLEVSSALQRLIQHEGALTRHWTQAPDAAPEAHRWLAHLLAYHAENTNAKSPADTLHALQSVTPLGPHPPPAAPRGTLFIFGLSTLGAGDQERISVLSHHYDIHLFIMSPSSAWWADYKSRRHAGEEELALQNPLLTALGQPSRLVQGWIETHDPYEDVTVPPAELNPDGGAPADEPARCFLGALQRWIDDASPQSEWDSQCRPDDGSLIFLPSYSPFRQCEALRDTLLALFEKDKTLVPADILVMTPDVATYAPLLEAAFSRRRGAPYIPLYSTDRGLRATNPTAEILIIALNLISERVTATTLLHILRLAPIRARFNLDPDDLAAFRTFVSQSKLFWAWDRTDRDAAAQPPHEAYTVLFALERLALGALYRPESELDALAGILPHALNNQSQLDRFGRFAQILLTLKRSIDALRTPRTPQGWRETLTEVLTDLSPDDPAQSRVLSRIQGLFPDVPLPHLLDPHAVKYLLEVEFDDIRRGDRPITGAVTLSALEPMRSVPFRVIALLGLDDTAFPRQNKRRSWDPLNPLNLKKIKQDLHDQGRTELKLKGEPDRSQIDRHLMLEAILSARDHLIVSWNGFDLSSADTLPASVVVEELLDTLSDLSGTKRDTFVHPQPLQPWSPHNFSGPNHSYDTAMAQAARALLDPQLQTAPPRIDTPLPGLQAPQSATASSFTRALLSGTRTLLKESLSIPLEPYEEKISDREPLSTDALDTHAIRKLYTSYILKGDGLAHETPTSLKDKTRLYLKAHALLPDGQLTEHLLDAHVKDAFRVQKHWHAPYWGTRQSPAPSSLNLPGGTTLHLSPQLLCEGPQGRWLHWLSPSSLRLPRQLEAWITLLGAKIQDPTLDGIRLFAWYRKADKDEPLPHALKERPGEPILVWELEAPDAAEALKILSRLEASWKKAHTQLTPLFPTLSATLAHGDLHGGVSDAAAQASWEHDLKPDHGSTIWERHIWGHLPYDRLNALVGSATLEHARHVWGPLLTAGARTLFPGDVDV